MTNMFRICLSSAGGGVRAALLQGLAERYPAETLAYFGRQICPYIICSPATTAQMRGSEIYRLSVRKAGKQKKKE